MRAVISNITHNNNVCVLDHTCDIDPSARIDCGCPGITAAQCVERGCCWNETIWGVPWCYQSQCTCKYFRYHCSRCSIHESGVAGKMTTTIECKMCWGLQDWQTGGPVGWPLLKQGALSPSVAANECAPRFMGPPLGEPLWADFEQMGHRPPSGTASENND